MTQKQITGLGPTQPDGSMKLFTHEPHPFMATAEWLGEQKVTPAIGDYLETDGQGVVTLLAEPDVSAAKAAPTTEPEEQEPEAQKKTDGLEGSGDGSNASQEIKPNYVALPVRVEAYEIVSVAEHYNDDDSLDLALSNGTNVEAGAEMLARITPEVGDYWVIQEDGYIYLNPKEVFERKYKSVTEH